MKQELSQKLRDEYPKIFATFRGFECGDGWFDIIKLLCYMIQSRIDFNSHLNFDQVVALQVKEKFGSLRFYVHGADAYVDGLISYAEALSGKTCDMCGKPGKSSGDGWIAVRCGEHVGQRRE